jgi:glycosyltransferase involved in cell wall biosynthesis
VESAPDIAVVIPTLERETRLAFALEALAQQTLDRDRFEVIVVRASGGRRSGRAEPPDGLRVRFVDCAAAGTAIQRNVGWRTAQAPLIAFTDDDCRPSPGWLEGMMGAEAGGGTILLGPTEPDPDERPLLAGLARTINNPRPSGWYETCNIAYPRELLEAVGGFDESIAFLGEDTDLAMRATKSGADVRFVVGALVWHAVDPRNLGTALRDVVRRSSRPAIVARHRELRASLWRGVFTDRDHARLLLALAGMLAARRAPALCALACAPYVKHHLGVAPLTPWRAVRFPFRLLSFAILDAAETLAFAASSVRHRVLVL